MTEIEMMPILYLPIVSVMMTALFSAAALFFTRSRTRRRSVDMDPAHLTLAAGTFLVLGLLMFALIYVSAPQLRHLAHGGF